MTDMRDIPKPGDRVLVDHAGKRGAFYAHVEKVTRRRLDLPRVEAEVPVGGRPLASAVQRWVNVSVTRVPARSG